MTDQPTPTPRTNGHHTVDVDHAAHIKFGFDVPPGMRLTLMVHMYEQAVRALRQERTGKVTRVLGQEPRELLLYLAEEFLTLHQKLNGGPNGSMPAHLFNPYGMTQLIREYLAADMTSSESSKLELYGKEPLSMLEYALPALKALIEWAKNTNLD